MVERLFLPSREMGRLLALDFGFKRTGIAITDPLKIIASPLETVATENLIEWLKIYQLREEVDRIIVGLPTKLDLSDTHTTGSVKKLIELLKTEFPKVPVSEIDERFTSKIAQQSMVLGGMKKERSAEKRKC